jgi:branched-chain amino acid transport system substrate-binding protein
LFNLRKTSQRVGIVAALAVGALILSACSSGTAAPAESSAALTGTPIKTVTVAAADWAGPTYESIFVAAKSYEKWVNENGGIAGHPLEITVCDDKGDPTLTAACARDAIAAGAIADVGSFSYNAYVNVPIYDAASTAILGNCCNLLPVEYTTNNTFQMGNNPVLNPGGVARAVMDGCKAISVLELDIPGVTDDTNIIFNNIAKAYGYEKELKFIRVPLTATDYSSVVAQATDGSDCISMFLGQNNISGMMAPFAQSGGTQTLYGAQGNLDSVSTKGYEELPGVKNSVVTGAYMPLDNAVWDTFRAALKASDAPSKFEYNSLGALGAWSSYAAFTQIAESITGDITPASFLAAAGTTVIDNGGMTPTIDFSETWDAFDGQYARAFSRQVTYMKIDGTPVDGGGWIDMSGPMQGNAP